MGNGFISPTDTMTAVSSEFLARGPAEFLARAAGQFQARAPKDKTTDEKPAKRAARRTSGA